MLNTVQDDALTLGVKERQERERAAVAGAILDAARDLFLAEGYQNVSIRKIAERIEYSPGAIYSYFQARTTSSSRLREGLHLLFSTAELRVDPGPDGLDALRAPFWQLYQFSRRYPEYFALMFVDRSVPRIRQNWERFSFVITMKAHITGLFQRAMDDGHLPRSIDPQAAFRVLHAAIVGAAVMQLCNVFLPGRTATHSRATRSRPRSLVCAQAFP